MSSAAENPKPNFDEDEVKHAPSLGHEEIASLMARLQDSTYRANKQNVQKKSEFEAKSLVEMAMTAQRRLEAEAIQRESGETAAEAEKALPVEGLGAPRTTPEVMPADDNADKDAAGELIGASSDEVAGENLSENIGETNGDTITENASQNDDQDEASEGPSVPETPVFDEAQLAAEFVRGQEAGKAEGYKDGQAAGLAEGQAKAAAELEKSIQQFETSAKALTAIQAVDLTELEASLQKVIVELASARAGQAIDELPDGFANRVAEIANRVAAKIEQPAISLNPADLAAILPLVSARETLKSFRFEADEVMMRGDIRIAADGIGVFDSLGARLQPEMDAEPVLAEGSPRTSETPISDEEA